MNISLSEKERKTITVGQAGHSTFEASNATGVRQITVQYDNDKIISLQLQFWDGSNSETFGNSKDGHKKNYFKFDVSDTLKSFAYRDSGYGHGSLRSFDIVTNDGKSFSAGHEGYDSQESPEVTGCRLLGFYGTTNKDGFISSFGLVISAKVLWVSVSNLVYDLIRKSTGEPQNISIDTVVNDQTKLEPGMEGNTVTRTQKYSRRKTNSWSSAFSNTHGESIIITAGAPELNISQAFTDSSTNTETTGGEITETWEDEYTVVVNGIPGKRCECNIFKTTNKVYIPFSCSTTIKYSDNSELVRDGSGLFEGTEEVYTARFTNGTGSFTPLQSAVKLEEASIA